MFCSSRATYLEIAPVHFSQFKTDAYPVHLRARLWREALKLHRLRPETGTSPTPFYGSLSSGVTPRGVGLVRITSSAQTIQRLAEPSDSIWLTLHLAGDAVLDDGLQTLDLAPGDIVVGQAKTKVVADQFSV